MIKKTLLFTGVMLAGMYAYGKTDTPNRTATPEPTPTYETSFEQNFDGNRFPPCETYTCWQKDGSATTTTAYALSAPNSVILTENGSALITPPMSTSGKIFTCRYMNAAVGDMLRMEYSTDGGNNWVFYRKHTATPNYWAEIKFDLSMINAVSVMLRISWEEYNDEGAIVYVDNCKLADKARGTFAAPVDFDGDKKSDLVAYYPGTGLWYIKYSSDESLNTRNWGWANAAPAIADYDGDGITDIAVFADGWWYIDSSVSGPLAPINYGFTGCIPVPADFNGDGIADPALYYPETGTWFVKFLTASMDTETAKISDLGAEQINWGFGETYPVPSDYDGDGMADICVYSPGYGTWYLLTSQSDYTQSEIVHWGWNEMLPIAADFTGDQTSTFGGYYSATGAWLQYPNQTLNNWGWLNAVPLIGDYDGDGVTDQGVTAILNGALYYYINCSSNGPMSPVSIASDELIPISGASIYNYLLYLTWSLR